VGSKPFPRYSVVAQLRSVESEAISGAPPSPRASKDRLAAQPRFTLQDVQGDIPAVLLSPSSVTHLFWYRTRDGSSVLMSSLCSRPRSVAARNKHGEIPALDDKWGTTACWLNSDPYLIQSLRIGHDAASAVQPSVLANHRRRNSRCYFQMGYQGRRNPDVVETLFDFFSAGPKVEGK
jgi:hypothetical protein